MPKDLLLESNHFTLQPLTNGVYACIHKPGGAAFSNAGIIDLGGQTLVLDTFHTMAAGRNLRENAEFLFKRLVETAVLTHGHLDHWIGACAFDASTTLLASKITHKVCVKWAQIVLEDFQNPSLWEEMLQETELRLQNERDERVRADHEHMLSFFRYIMAERTQFQPRTPDRTFENTLTIQGTERTVELRGMSRGHSEDDSVLLLPQDGIAFIGDIGFFDAQPQLNVCDLDQLRQQINFFNASDIQTLVPGHGPVGGKGMLAVQLQYIDVLEDQVGKVVERGGSLQEAMQITMPDPFNKWLMVGMAMFEGNVSALFKRAGGEVPEQE